MHSAPTTPHTCAAGLAALQGMLGLVVREAALARGMGEGEGEGEAMVCRVGQAGQAQAGR